MKLPKLASLIFLLAVALSGGCAAEDDGVIDGKPCELEKPNAEQCPEGFTCKSEGSSHVCRTTDSSSATLTQTRDPNAAALKRLGLTVP